MDEQVKNAAMSELASGIEYNQPQPITMDDVADVEAYWTDGNDEPEFAWLLRLGDGRYAAGSGGHDYTGWDCQSGLVLTVYATRDEAIRFGLTLNDRCNLGLLLEGESMTEAK